MFKKIVNYIKESKIELKNVSWLSRKETTNHTLVVIGISLGVAIFLALADFVFSSVLGRLIGQI